MAYKIRAEAVIAIKKHIDVVFEDDGIVAIEDQAVDHIRDKLKLDYNHELDVLAIRCFAHHGR